MASKFAVLAVLFIDACGSHFTSGESALQLELGVSAPKYARVDGDIETLWQRPDDGPVAGILFMAHGCMHQAPDFFSHFESCSHSNFGKCLGLPEELQFVRLALKRKYLVMAVSGGFGIQSCWDMKADPRRVEQAIRHVANEEKLSLTSTPILATGASSGGAFMGPLALHLASVELGLRCAIPQISGIAPSFAKNMKVPTIFLPMERDARTMAMVDQNIAALLVSGRAKKIVVPQVPLESELKEHATKNWQQIIDRLKQRGFLDEEGQLKSDPRRSSWRKALADLVQEDSMVADESHLSELMNIAYAQHEFTSRFAGQALDFCEGN